MTTGHDGAHLRDILNRAAALGVGAQAAQDPLVAAVGAVRASILPRRITLAVNGQVGVDLFALGGRLLRMEPAPRDPGPEPVAALLRARLSGGGALALTFYPWPEAPQGQRGISASDLNAALGLAPPARAARAHLLAAAGERLIGVVDVHGLHHSRASLPAPVQARIQRWIAPGGLAETLGRDELMVFAIDSPPLGIGLLVTEGKAEAMVFDAAACAELARIWSAPRGLPSTR